MPDTVPENLLRIIGEDAEALANEYLKDPAHRAAFEEWKARRQHKPKQPYELEIDMDIERRKSNCRPSKAERADPRPKAPARS
jgi:hypothetical protein